MDLYKDILTKGGEIYHKTDNMGMFEYSICQLSQKGFALKNVSLDLLNSGFENNIMTEHEVKYSQMDKPIYRLEAYLPENN